MPSLHLKRFPCRVVVLCLSSTGCWFGPSGSDVRPIPDTSNQTSPPELGQQLPLRGYSPKCPRHSRVRYHSSKMSGKTCLAPFLTMSILLGQSRPLGELCQSDPAHSQNPGRCVCGVSLYVFIVLSRIFNLFTEEVRFDLTADFTRGECNHPR